MTTWAQFRQDFKAAIALLVPGHQVVWRDEKRPFQKPNSAWVILNQQTTKAISPTDDVRLQNGTDPLTFDEQIVGWRLCTISCKVETNQQTDLGVAWNVAETVVMKLRSFNDQSSVNDVFSANSVEDFDDNDRARSVVVFDILMNVLITDVGLQAIGTFDHIELTSHAQTIPGIDLSSPPNYANQIIPDDVQLLALGSDTLVSGTDNLVNA